MSEQLRHKMINSEASPPPAAWNAIAARLDDDRQYTAVATKMNNFDAMPPLSSWEAITARLDDDRQYAVVATKMNNFDASLPAQVWNNIADFLQDSKEETTPVIPIRRTVYRAAAAAIVIGLFIGGWMLFITNKVKIETVINNSITLPGFPAPEENSKISGGRNTPNQKEEIVAAQEQPVQNNTKSRYKDPVLKYAIVNSLPAYHENSIVISSSPILDKDGALIRGIDELTIHNNYLIVMGPNGQSTRISPKFANVIHYLNGNSDDTEEYIDKVIKESDTWKKRFQEWRNKISRSSFIPSSANFLDIIEFKELIQEKQ